MPRGVPLVEDYHEDVAFFSDLADLKDSIRRQEEFLRQRHKFIRFGRHGTRSRIGLPTDLMMDIEGGLYDPHAMSGELGGSAPVRYEQGVSVYFATRKGNGWEPRDPDRSRASYGLSDYWNKMARFFTEAICSGDVFLVEASLIREMERVPIELDWSPEQEYRRWRDRWEKQDLQRRKQARLGLTLTKRSRATWRNAARTLGAIQVDLRGALGTTHYFPNERLLKTMRDLIAQHGPTTRQLPRGVRQGLRSIKVPEPPGAPKIEEVPERLPTHAVGADGEPVVEDVKVLTRLDPFGTNPKLPRLHLPFRFNPKTCRGRA